MRPGRGCGIWGRAGTRLIAEATACVQQLRDLLECVWPAVLSASVQSVRCQSWCAALAVVLDRCNGHPERLARLGSARFEAAVRRELARWGGQRLRRSIVAAVFAALSDPAGVAAQRPGALERAEWVLADWRSTRPDWPRWKPAWSPSSTSWSSTELVTSIPGISAVGAAAILAETGDPTRFDSPRALVKHAGLCPRENSQRHRHRPVADLRARPTPAAAGRLARGVGRPAQQSGDGRPLPAPDHPQSQPAVDGQARAAFAAALLRWLHVIVTRHVTWDVALAGAGHLPAAA